MSTTGTTIALKKTGTDKAIGKAITEFLQRTKEAKDAEKLAGLAKKTIADFAEAQWLKLFEDASAQPATPFKIVNADGESVGFTVQDKSDGYTLKEEAAAGLACILGLGNDAMERVTSFGLNSAVLREPCVVHCGNSVGEVMAWELNNFLAKQVQCGHISRDQASRLFTCEKVEVLKANFLGRLPELAKRAGVQIKELLDVVGSAVVRFVR
jgi:hypothetical protein